MNVTKCESRLFALWILIAAISCLALSVWARAADTCPTGAAGEEATCPVAHGGAKTSNDAPTTQPAAPVKLTIIAKQGSAGAPAIGAGDPVTIELYRRGEAAQKLDTKLDVNGQAVVENIMVSGLFQPVVTITHSGVAYEAVGKVAGGSDVEQHIEVTVRETTQQEPQWTIKMRHVMVQAAPGGLQVMEMISVQNPADRAWLGIPVSEGKYRSLVLPLPKAAEDVQLLSGFHECCTKIEGGKITSAMPLLPGESQFQIGYRIPTSGGQAALSLTAPKPVSHMMVFVPNDGSPVEVKGLESMGAMKMQKSEVRVYKASECAAGQEASIIIRGLVAAASMDIAEPQVAAAPILPRFITGVGGGLILLLGLGIALIRPGKKAKVA